MNESITVDQVEITVMRMIRDIADGSGFGEITIKIENGQPSLIVMQESTKVRSPKLIYR